MGEGGIQIFGVTGCERGAGGAQGRVRMGGVSPRLLRVPAA